MTLKVIKRGHLSEGQQVMHAKDVYNVVRFLEKEDREKFYALHLNAKNRIIAKELVAVGTLNNSLVHPREIFKGAILNNSASIILVHNHPSNDTSPSENDIEVTKRLIDAGNLIGIEVLDHIIIGYKTYTSMMEKRICFQPDEVQEEKSYTERRLIMKDRSLNDRRSHINKAIDILTITAEELKEKEALNKKEIRKLSKTLQEAVGNIYYFIGVAPQVIEKCYRMTAKYLKDTPPEKRVGYLPML